MSTFLTPPEYYNSNGYKDRALMNEVFDAYQGAYNTAFGYGATAGFEYGGSGEDCAAVALGAQAKATASYSIAIGSYDNNIGNVQALGTGSIAIGAGAIVEQTGGMAIGRGARALQGGIAIGEGASADGNQIQLGNPSTRYDLKVGNGNGSINGKINVTKFTSPSTIVNINGIVPGENYVLFIVAIISGDATKYTSYMMVHNSIGDVAGSPIVVLNGKGDLVTYRPILALDSSAATHGELYFRYETETSGSASTISNIDVYMMKIS